MPNFWENDPLVQDGGPQPTFVVPDPQQAVDNRRAARDDARDDAALELRRQTAAIQAAQEQRAQDEFDRKQREAAAKEQAQAAGIQDSLAQMRAVVQAAREAKDLSRNWFATGFGSETAAGISGTAARDIRARLDTIAANNAFSQLQAMRAASPTGGALGAVSERELQLLQSTISSLDPTQSDSQFRDSMDAIIANYQRVIDRLDPQQGGTRRPEMVDDVPRGTQVDIAANRILADGEFDRSAYLQNTYGITPNQEATLTAFWNANLRNPRLTPEGVKAFYREQGIDPPDDAAIAATIEQAQQSVPFGGIDTTDAESAWQQRVAQEAAAMDEVAGRLDNVDLAGHGIMAGLGDEAAGIGTAISGALQGDFNLAQNYRLGNDVQDYRLDAARERGGPLGTVAELLGNAASLGSGAVGAVPASARGAAVEGAIAGAIPGYGYGEGAGGSVSGALLGAGVGAGLGAGLYRLGAGGGSKPPTAGQRVIRAADQLNDNYGTNISPIAADVAGPTVRRATGVTAQLPLGASPIIKASENLATESQAARDSIARAVGTPQEIELAGQQALQGAQKWMASSRARVGTLYNRARNAAEGVRIPLTNARRVLDEHIAELSDTPGGSNGLDELKALSEEIGQDYTVEGIKRMRTQLRDRFASTGLRGSDIERRALQVVDAAEEDIAEGLTAAGRPEAAEAYRQAAAAYRERVQIIDNTMAPIIGRRGDDPRSGEQIMQAIGRMTRSDNAKLAKFLDALPEEDAGTVRATIISQLGRATDGAQNAAGDAFSLSRFLTEWNRMTPGAKRTLFGGEERAALDNLATVAEGTKEAQRFANFSNTGSVLGLLTTGGGVTADLASGGAFAGGQYLTARLLASPKFARWLARMPKNPDAIERHLEGLGRIAAAETAIAGDALGLQQALAAQFGGPMRLAAEEPADSRTTTAPGQQ
ncbi:hypothetical protein [Aurantiacibacter spongiae]|uniref:Uncharacterized protein n=1 Tax=Aurantiacibacter spongiae TaxID=2488860 RepID=A0A3N5DFM0_9SPHN|nr:hypothetical protein [Aurantiacibacter spongiae]RPF70442.1 hypothetical protein EG799_01465 [Aurantiacibacter spongiae]